MQGYFLTTPQTILSVSVMATVRCHYLPVHQVKEQKFTAFLISMLFWVVGLCDDPQERLNHAFTKLSSDTQRPIGSKVYYTCDSGYEKQGENQLICNSNAEWEGQINCNGKYYNRLSCNSFQFLSYCRFKIQSDASVRKWSCKWK